MSHPTSIDVIARSLACDNIKTKIAALEILGAVCLVPGGHKKVLTAMMNFQEFASERARFQSIMNDLDRSTGLYRDDVNLKTAIMSFINAVLNYGASDDQLEFRLHLRFEFVMLGIQPVIEKLRKHENETLDRHLDFFEMMRTEDDKELSRKFSNESVDAESSIEMFDLLRRKLSYSAAYPHFMSLMQHMLLLPCKYKILEIFKANNSIYFLKTVTGSNPHHWLLFDRVVQQLVLQTEERPTSDIESFFDKHMGGSKTIDPDIAPLDIDVNKIVKLLVKEEELVAATNRAEVLEKENLEMTARVSKKEHELDLRTQEKEDLETGLTRMRERLEKESSNHSQTVQRALTAEMKVEDLQHKFVTEQQERLRLERLVTEGSIPDDQKVAGLQGCNGTTSPISAPAPMAPKMPPPPPPMMMSNIPPPPGPPPAPSPSKIFFEIMFSIKRI